MNLKDLKPLAKKLNTKTDELTASLRTVEDSLNEMGLGIETRLAQALTTGPKTFRPLGAEGARAHAEYIYTSTHLGYGRHGDRWALVVHSVTNLGIRDQYSNIVEDEEQEDENPKPLLQASRAIRIKAVEHIEPLIEQLQKEAQTSLEKIEKARQIAVSIGADPDVAGVEAWRAKETAMRKKSKRQTAADEAADAQRIDDAILHGKAVCLNCEEVVEGAVYKQVPAPGTANGVRYVVVTPDEDGRYNQVNSDAFFCKNCAV
jgi:hypothetical protein